MEEEEEEEREKMSTPARDSVPKVDENGQPLSKSALKKLAAKAEEAKKAARAARVSRGIRAPAVERTG